MTDPPKKESEYLKSLQLAINSLNSNDLDILGHTNRFEDILHIDRHFLAKLDSIQSKKQEMIDKQEFEKAIRYNEIIEALY